MPASQLFSGTGDPNGVVYGNPGDLYQEQTGQVWLNVVAPTTWIQLVINADLGWFGTGVDGDHTVVGPEIMLRDRFYRNLTIKAGGSLRTLGFRLYVCGKLTIEVGGLLHNSGEDGQNGADAIPGFSRALGGNGAPTTNMLGGGKGGDGGFDDQDGLPGQTVTEYPFAEPIKNAGKGGDATSGVGGAGGTSIPQFGFGTYMISTMVMGSFVSGGPGGGGGAGNIDGGGSGDVGFGGGGGGGGGTMMVSAKTIDAAPSTIAALGGKGGDGASDGAGGGIGGGGGGAVGGTIIIVTNDPAPPVVNFAGGAGGIGFNGGTNGLSGDPGALIAISPAWGPI